MHSEDISQSPEGRQVPVRNADGDVIEYFWVDSADFDATNAEKWHLSKGYPASSKSKLLIHRFLLQPEPWVIVDHIDRDKLNNRRSNLRVVTAALNAHNRTKRQGTSSSFKGVIKDCNNEQRWLAKFGDVHLGTFYSEDAAAWKYDEYARSIFGQDAVINGVQKPDDYELMVGSAEKRQEQGIPKGISRRKDKWRVRLFQDKKLFYSAQYCNFEDAVRAMQSQRLEIARLTNLKQFEQQEDCLTHPVTRNQRGEAVIYTNAREEILVSDADWHAANQIKWHLNRDGYAYGRDSSLGSIIMHRWLLQAGGCFKQPNETSWSTISTESGMTTVGKTYDSLHHC
jgi:hypothetical protein